MTRRIEALYENGVFRPLEPLEGVAEHSRVVLELREVSPYNLRGFVGTLPDEDAREMAQIIDEEFENVDPDKWR